MEADVYLSSGFGIRTAIEGKKGGWVRFQELARAWMPGRLKGIRVSREDGTPFLAATQVYDVRPTPRKWLALTKTSDSANRFVNPGTILVTCSGSVGKATLSHAAHEGTLISHDLLRIEPLEKKDKGWIYAYLHAPQVYAMAIGAKYGHIIKHLETSHLDVLPVPTIDDETALSFSHRVDRILHLRSEAHRMRAEADAKFSMAIGPIKDIADKEGFIVRAGDLFLGRRRFEASFYSPEALAIIRRFKRFERAADVTMRIWWEGRFRRFYGEDGIPYLSADELFTVNPPDNKRILVAPGDRHSDYFVKEGWIVMACSGQVYGLNGAAALMTKHHEGIFFSHDLIRIVADPEKIRSGYLLIALTHPTLGRPLLIRAAYGTSIPHLDPGDVAETPIVRLNEKIEAEIADLAEASAKARADADALEREIAKEAGEIIDRFMARRH